MGTIYEQMMGLGETTMRLLKRKGSRLCSILLALVLVMSLIPTQAVFASAEENAAATEAVQPVENDEEDQIEPVYTEEADGSAEAAASAVQKKEVMGSDTPAEKPAETLAEKPAETSADTPSEKLAETPLESAGNGHENVTGPAAPSATTVHWAKSLRQASTDEKVCPSCGQVLIPKKMDADQHAYWCFTKGCAMNGPQEYEDHTLDSWCNCEVCGDHCHDHTYIYNNGVHIPATCTEPGYDCDGYCEYCSRCGRWTDAQTEVGKVTPALGHDWVVDTTEGAEGWIWNHSAADHSYSATACLKCQRADCGEATRVTDSTPEITFDSYNEQANNVQLCGKATVEKDGKTFTSEVGLVATPTDRVTSFWVVGDQTYTEEPASVPETISCHYQREDGWSGPVDSDIHVEEENGVWYRCITRTYTKNVSAKDSYIQKVAATEATCTEPATAEHYQCRECKKLYTEKEALNEVTMEDLQIGTALGHDLTATAKVGPTCTATGTEAYWTCTRDNCGKLFSDAESKNEIDAPVVIKALGHKWNEWHIVKAPQIGKVGERQRSCSRCDETETETIAALIGYSVSSGADGNWKKGSGSAYTITVKRSEDDASCFSHYAETLIDGKSVSVSAKAGSTVITIGADTLEKLSAGTHTVTVSFDDGMATTTLTVKNKATSKEDSDSSRSKESGAPLTGDNSNTMLWISLLCASTAILAILVMADRKRKTLD